MTQRRSQSQKVHARHTTQLERIQRQVEDGMHYRGSGWLHSLEAQNQEMMTSRMVSWRLMKVSLDIAYIAIDLTI